VTLPLARVPLCATLLAAVLGAWTAAGCGRGGDPPPQAPSTARSTTPVRISGAKKVEWGQAAFDSTQLARYRYVLYVDDVPTDLVDATCGRTTTNNATFPCSASLPKLAAGLHRLQLAVEEKDGRQRRSPRSGELLVDVEAPNATP
jgi:hypothetical protein